MKHRPPSRGLRVALSFIAVAAAHAAFAAGVPGSGQILQEVQPPAPPPPASRPALKIEQTAPGAVAASPPFKVEKIQVTGNALLPESLVRAIVAPAEGGMMTLPDLDALAGRITAEYRDRGYMLARAYVPAQTLSNGTVRIAVVEARYGAVRLDNRSAIASRPLEALLSPLQAGQAVDQAPLDRSLLLLSDVPGIVVNSILRPGSSPGTSDLAVDVAPGAGWSGNATLDNAGNRYTGRARLGGTININNPLRRGDQFTANVLGSGEKLSYMRLGYQAPIGDQGTRLAATYSGLRYRLGDSLAPLGVNGTAGVTSLVLTHPVIRGVDSNLYAQLEYSRKQLRDHVDTTGIFTDRTLRSLTASLAGDRRDASGIFNWNAAITAGRNRFDDPLAQFIDQLSSATEGGYRKLALSASRVQQLSAVTALYVGASVQSANRNLDTSEQFIVGGPGSVRGYDVGSAAGSRGSLVTAELRHILNLDLPGTWQGTFFIDSARISVYKNPFPGSGVNDATLTAAGLGMNWFGPVGWSATAVLAAPVNGTPTLLAGKTSSARLWLQVQKNF